MYKGLSKEAHENCLGTLGPGACRVAGCMYLEQGLYRGRLCLVHSKISQYEELRALWRTLCE